MNKLLSIGLATSLAFSTGACAGEKEPNINSTPAAEGTAVITENEAILLARPNAINDPDAKIGALKVGQKAVATCFFESATLGADSVKVSSGSVEGFAFMWHYENLNEADHKVIYTFSKPVKELQKLPECTTQETLGVEG